MKTRYILITMTLMQYSLLTMAQQSCLTQIEIPASAPSGNFLENHDETVSDKITGLMWAKCQQGHSGLECQNGGTGGNLDAQTFDWQQALQEAENSTLAGYGNWRLPNIKELESLIEYSCIAPALNLQTFPRVSNSQSITWTSSIANLFDDQSFYVNFFNGTTSADTRTTLRFVRLVRDQ